ncbi:MAG: hypothetical protein ACQESX_02115 [Bacteroidota bacterium]
MRNLLLILSFAFLISCNQKDHSDEAIEIFNKYTFKLENAESSIPLTDEIHQRYDSLIAGKELQIPLFKYVESSDYKLYIGVPYNTSLKNIKDQEIFPGTLRTSQRDKPGEFTYKTYTAYGSFLAEYAENLEGNLVYLLGVSRSKPVADSVFSRKAFSNRIKKP